MQAAEYRFRAYNNALPQPMAEVRWSCDNLRCVRRPRHARTQTAVRPSTVVMLYPDFQDRAQVRLRYRNQPVQALAAYRADHSFADRIRLRRPRWRFQHTQAQRLDRFVQVLREDAVSIVKQVTVGTVHTNNFSQLLQGPVRARVCRDIDAHQSPATMLDDHKHVEHSEGRGDSNEEVARQNRFCVQRPRNPAIKTGDGFLNNAHVGNSNPIASCKRIYLGFRVAYNPRPPLRINPREQVFCGALLCGAASLSR